MVWIMAAFVSGMVLGQRLEQRAWLKTLKESDKELDAFVEKAVAELEEFAEAVRSGESDGEERGLN